MCLGRKLQVGFPGLSGHNLSHVLFTCSLSQPIKILHFTCRPIKAEYCKLQPIRGKDFDCRFQALDHVACEPPTRDKLHVISVDERIFWKFLLFDCQVIGYFHGIIDD